MNNLILFNGGIGKHIAVTGVLENYFKKYPNDYLVIKNLDIFKNLEINNISQFSINFSFLKDKNLKIIEPYYYKEVYNNKESIVNITNWLLTDKKEYIQPKLILTDDEKELGLNYIKKYITSDLKSCIMFQPFGSKFETSNKLDISFRSLNFNDYIGIVEKLKNNFKLLIFRKNNSFSLIKKTYDISFWDFRKIASICYHLDHFISCDSCLNHLAPALNKSAFVFWINTSEKIFGHPININYREKEGQSMIPLGICIPEKVLNQNLNKFDLEQLLLNINKYLER